MARQVLVTGASGFVGSHLTEALEAQGYSVLAMTRHPDTHSGAGKPIFGDVYEPASLSQALADALTVAIRDIPSVRRARIGRRVTHGRPYEQLMDVDYEYAAVLEFDDVDGLQAYLAHPAHEALAARFFEFPVLFSSIYRIWQTRGHFGRGPGRYCFIGHEIDPSLVVDKVYLIGS